MTMIGDGSAIRDCHPFFKLAMAVKKANGQRTGTVPYMAPTWLTTV